MKTRSYTLYVTNRLLGGLLALTLLTVITIAVVNDPIASSSFVGAENAFRGWVPITAFSPYGTQFQKAPRCPI